MDIAIKNQRLLRKQILKAKEVQYALKFANEENFKDSFELLDENYKDVIKMYPRDRDWKKLVSKYRRDIDKFRNNNKDLPKKVEDDLISWALDAGEISNKGEVEDFIDAILNESTLSEGKNLMPDIQKIVDTKGAKKVGGIMIDMFTASMINQIYNKVNDKNKQRMEKSNINTLVDLAQRMMQKMGDNLGEGKGTDIFKKYNKLIGRLSDNEQCIGTTMNTRRYKRFGKVKELLNMDYTPEGVNLQEGTWAVPDSYPKLVKLQKILNTKNIAKDPKQFLNLQI